MTISLWSGVSVKLQSALGASQVISSITKANPAVVTYVGADPANGDYIKITVTSGMSQLNNRVVRVANVNTGGNTFECESENSTNYDTFVSGGMEPITFGTTVSTMRDVNASGGDFAQVDTTTIHDLVKSQIPGAANPSKLAGNFFWDPADAGFIAMKAASDIKAQLCCLLAMTNGKKAGFVGYVGFSGLPTGSAQDAVVTPGEINMFGRPSYWAT